jgi:thymidylate synthase
MRISTNFTEALNEIKRDLAEMGIEVHPQTMQDKDVRDNPDYETKELSDYCYTVKNAADHLSELSPTQPWADAEFVERISPTPINPGDAYLLRKDVWTEFLHEGRFAYTYSERMFWKLHKIVNEIKKNPDSRQLYLNIWEGDDLRKLGGISRVPCSLGYHIKIRNGKLNLTYMMRSCDYATHFQNDVYLACMLMRWLAAATGYEAGNFTHFIGSFHIYKKDAQGVF